jgi:DNA uptake protein ComE-like DNA-binding protein
MKQYLKDFFNYSRTEQRGTILLVILIVSFEALRMNWQRLFPPDPPAEILFSELPQQWMNAKLQKEDSVFQRKIQGRDQQSTPSLLSPFDPNRLDLKGWQAMGFSPRESVAILKYTQKGGRFRKKEDLKKLFCMTEKRYAVLSPFVKIDTTTSQQNQTKKNSFKRAVIIELNTADSLELIQVKGIGKFRASQILRRRKLLGGFWNTKQLLEIKNFPDSTYQQILPFINLDTSQIQKIKINVVGFDELQKHPYFWYGVAKSIVNYRNKHGPFRQPSDLQAIYAIKPEQLEKVVHYITFE